MSTSCQHAPSPSVGTQTVKLVECEGRSVVLTNRPQTRPQPSGRPESSMRMQPRPDIRDAIVAARRLPERSRPPRCALAPLGRQLPTEIVEHPLPSACHAIRPEFRSASCSSRGISLPPPWRAAACLCMIASSHRQCDRASLNPREVKAIARCERNTLFGVRDYAIAAPAAGIWCWSPDVKRLYIRVSWRCTRARGCRTRLSSRTPEQGHAHRLRASASTQEARN
jgi:hypothetical protein